MEGTAVQRRLTWQVATVAAETSETPEVRTIELAVPDWPGHRAGQHLDVRLTAEDGYVAELRVGDMLELRGPVGGYFVWEKDDGGPLLLVAGGSGIVPLRAIIRQHQRSGSDAPVRLLYSARTLPDVIYRAELDGYRDGIAVSYTLTREQPPGWTGYARRVDAGLLAEVAWPTDKEPLVFVCGPTNFVETTAGALVGLGYRPEQVKTERFGGTGVN
jgi:ferredoxin-NADP reductase